LKVKVKTAGYRGNVAKSVAVTSDDPARPDVTLKVRMALVGSVELMPAHRLMLRHRAGQSTTGKILVRKDPTESGTLEITELVSTEPWLAIRARKVHSEESMKGGFKPAPGDYMIEAEVPESPGSGMHHAEVRFRTGLPREPVIRIPVIFSARAFGAASIKQLYLRRKDPGTPWTGRMNFNLLGNTDPQSVEVSITPDRFKVEVEIMAQGRLQVLVTEDPDQVDGQEPPQGMLLFTRGAETIKVPVRLSER
jgi:hypothetical protein